MSANDRAGTTHLRAVALYIAGVLLFLFFAVQWYFSLQHTGRIAFIDATVYARAISVFNAGGDPYVLSSTDLPFVYPRSSSISSVHSACSSPTTLAGTFT